MFIKACFCSINTTYKADRLSLCYISS